jgi:hypothetical protein
MTGRDVAFSGQQQGWSETGERQNFATPSREVKQRLGDVSRNAVPPHSPQSMLECVGGPPLEHDKMFATPGQDLRLLCITRFSAHTTLIGGEGGLLEGTVCPPTAAWGCKFLSYTGLREHLQMEVLGF